MCLRVQAGEQLAGGADRVNRVVFPLTAISPTCSPAPARYRARLLAASPDHLVRRMILVAHISLWLFDPPAHGCSRTTTCIRASEAVHIRCSATSLARSVEPRRLPGCVTCPLIMKVGQRPAAPGPLLRW